MIGAIEYHSLQVQILRYSQAKTDEHKCKIARGFFDYYLEARSDATQTLEALNALMQRVAKLEHQLKEDKPHEDTQSE